MERELRQRGGREKERERGGTEGERVRERGHIGRNIATKRKRGKEKREDS